MQQPMTKEERRAAEKEAFQRPRYVMSQRDLTYLGMALCLIIFAIVLINAATEHVLLIIWPKPESGWMSVPWLFAYFAPLAVFAIIGGYFAAPSVHRFFNDRDVTADKAEEA